MTRMQVHKPFLFIGCPLRAALSQTNNISFSRMSEEDVRRVVAYGTCRLDLCMVLSRLPMRNGRTFHNVHPAGARS